MKRLNLLTGVLFGLIGLVSLLGAHWLTAAIWLVLALGIGLSDLQYAGTAASTTAAVPLPPVRKAASIFLVVVALLLMGYQIGQDLTAHHRARPAATGTRS